MTTPEVLLPEDLQRAFANRRTRSLDLDPEGASLFLGDYSALEPTLNGDVTALKASGHHRFLMLRDPGDDEIDRCQRDHHLVVIRWSNPTEIVDLLRKVAGMGNRDRSGQ